MIGRRTTTWELAGVALAVGLAVLLAVPISLPSGRPSPATAPPLAKATAPSPSVLASAQTGASTSAADPPAPTIDGTSTGSCSGTGSCTILLNPRPTHDLDVIVVVFTICTQEGKAYRYSVSGGGLQFHQQVSLSIGDSDVQSCVFYLLPVHSSFYLREVEYWAVSTADHPFDQTITLSISIGGDDSRAGASALAFGVAGADLQNPYASPPSFLDGNPATDWGYVVSARAAFTTRATNDLVVGLVGLLGDRSIRHSTDSVLNGKSPNAAYFSWYDITSLRTGGASGIFGEYLACAPNWCSMNSPLSPASFSVNTVGPSGAISPWGILAEAFAPATFPATVSASPSPGPTGTAVTLSGAGYAPGQTYRYCWEAAPGTSVCTSGYARFVADNSGAIPPGPSTVVPGFRSPFLVVSTDSNTGSVVAAWAYPTLPATFSLSGPLSGSNTAFGPSGTFEYFSVGGLVSGRTYSVYLDSSRGARSGLSGLALVSSPSNPSVKYSRFLALSGGTFAGRLYVPGLASGTYSVDLYENASGNFVTPVTSPGPGTFVLTAASATLAPARAPVGASIALTLSGTFAPRTGYGVCLDARAGVCTASVANFVTNDAGTAPSAVSFTIAPTVLPRSDGYAVDLFQVGNATFPNMFVFTASPLLVVVPAGALPGVGGEVGSARATVPLAILGSSSAMHGRAVPPMNEDRGGQLALDLLLASSRL